MNQTSSQNILSRAAGGDQEAWRELIQTYSHRVYGVVYRQCRNAELAEEITQAAFVTVVDKLPDYQETGRFESWLFRIAINRLRDEMRRRKRQAVTLDFSQTPPETVSGHRDEHRPEHGMIQQEQAEQLNRAIAQLSEADQQVIYLRYTGSLGFQEIADTLDQPLGTVLARAHRALKKLQGLMASSPHA